MDGGEAAALGRQTLDITVVLDGSEDGRRSRRLGLSSNVIILRAIAYRIRNIFPAYIFVGSKKNRKKIRTIDSID